MDPRLDPSQFCRHLRCKEMFAQGENELYHAQNLFDPYDATAFWCAKTQTGRGPDGKRAHVEECSPGCERPCFLGIEA